ncbi:low-density lipoprotein receptor-related protein 6-like isoform X2 [Mytilus edulis]|uniref:low-density lipoprotein receptor-related protein 6-like isoform X2 n=1 Tax=Mytilus edulis TaxID=6550 RepID=UPI0039EF5A10
MANEFKHYVHAFIVFEFMIKIWITKAEDANPWLMHTNKLTIDRLEMDIWTNSTLVRGMVGAVSVDYHYTKGFLYYSDQVADRISRMNLRNPHDAKDIITNTLGLADAIAVDWIYDHLYWVDASHDHIMVSNLDGSRRKTIINTELVYPRALAVYPNIGWMFYTDVEDPKIERCGLDGSNRQAIVTTNIGSPNGLSIDFAENRLYWVDNHVQSKQIKSSAFDGTDIRILMTSADNLPWAFGLVVYKEWLYITQFTNNTVCRVDKQTGSNFQIIRSDADTPVGIKIYSGDNQPHGTSLCIPNNGDCEQLCLPTPQNTSVCACADEFELNSDAKTCLFKGSGKWLTYANLNTIERMDLETNVTETIAARVTNAVDLDIHYEKGYVYWSDVRAKKISRSAVNRTSISGSIEDIVVERVDVPDGITIDWMYNLLYWTDTGHNHIQVSRLDGTNRKTIIKNDSSLDQPRAIVVDPSTGLLFFSDWGSQPRIERCRMDGGERTIIINSDIIWPNGMTIDHIGKRLYWIDGSLNQIKSTRFDGTDTYTIIKNADVLPKPYDLVVYGSYVYWSNWQYRTICRVNKYTGQEFSVVVKYIRSPMGIQVFADEVQPKGKNVCEPNNGGCSHICFPLPAYNSAQSSSSGYTEIANPDLTKDTGVTSREIIVYPIIGVVVVILITVVLILIFWYRRRNTSPRSERTYEEPDNRISTVSAIYDTIDEQTELTSKMNNSNSGSVNPYLELSSSRTDPKNTYSDLIRINGDMNMPKCGTE